MMPTASRRSFTHRSLRGTVKRLRPGTQGFGRFGILHEGTLPGVMRHPVLAVAAVFCLAACGGNESTSSPGQDTTEVTTAEVTTTEETTTEVVDEACREQLEPLVEALSELDSRLTVGLNYERYSESVSDNQVAYDRVPFDELGPECVTDVGIPLEKAVNAYVKAYNIWSNCFEDIDCSNDSIKGRLQKHWAKATRQIARAEQNLEALSG